MLGVEPGTKIVVEGAGTDAANGTYACVEEESNVLLDEYGIAPDKTAQVYSLKEGVKESIYWYAAETGKNTWPAGCIIEDKRLTIMLPASMYRTTLRVFLCIIWRFILQFFVENLARTPCH